MRLRIDLTGKKFGRLTVLSRADNNKLQVCWRVRCDCGEERTVQGGNLKSGRTKSCGCYNRDYVRKGTPTHGLSNSVTYRCWSGMLARCRNKKYKNYGGRGIAVCPRWKKFENFLEDMGFRPDGLTLERINNNAGYSPENCRWATPLEQGQNTRKTRLLTHNGQTLSMSEWGRRLGLLKATISFRLQSGYSVNAALTAIKHCRDRNNSLTGTP